ncbi:hypothetical protein Lalb_Chr02g0155831 [Lupinus albus]|uniref:Uncharacterized protein n=1 Tax=Lupinus albus TaxID=3870 RepID=A0A6A4R0N5_LUPAL|nr:hypothetical protein Lalb_Chr02g0155831 [Lupinus albus]
MTCRHGIEIDITTFTSSRSLPFFSYKIFCVMFILIVQYKTLIGDSLWHCFFSQTCSIITMMKFPMFLKIFGRLNFRIRWWFLCGNCYRKDTNKR